MKNLRWIIIDDGKFQNPEEMMKNVFNIDKDEYVDIQLILKTPYENVSDLIKKILKSSLNERQKNLAMYIIGTTLGINACNE